jgi:hypothetical protein
MLSSRPARREAAASSRGEALARGEADAVATGVAAGGGEQVGAQRCSAVATMMLPSQALQGVKQAHPHTSTALVGTSCGGWANAATDRTKNKPATNTTGSQCKASW